MAQLLELSKSKPRGKESEVLLAEISRLESALIVVRDDLVRLCSQLPSMLLTPSSADRAPARRV